MMRCIAWLALLSLCQAYKVLVVFPFPSKSHSILGDGVVRHLVAAKHEVTYITPFPWKSPPTNLHQVVVSDVIALFPNVLDLKSLMDKKVDLNDQNLVNNIMMKVVRNILEQDNMKRFLDDPSQNFDVVVAEWMFSEVYGGIGAVFEAPMVWCFPFEHPSVILSLIDEAPNPAYTSNIYLPDVLPFNFMQRVKSLYMQSLIYYYKFHSYTADEEDIYNTSYGPIFQKRGRKLPSFIDVRFNVSLALVNSHISLGTSLKLPQNYINVGGYHVETPVKPLPEDLKKIMDNAKNGVIYFSLGSNLKSKDLPQEIKKGLLKMFGGLKQTVFWKFEETLPDLPKNVHILNWAPQPSILAHPNCVLFITHGGLLSTIETVHFGKPIIGIPVFADQFLNVDKAVTKGYAKRVDLTYDVVSDLKVAIDEILKDSRCSETAKELSMIYHDRVVPPGTELVHWVEHVARTGGAQHLRSPALGVPLYQKLYLDLAALLLAALFLLWKLIKRLLCFGTKKSVDVKADGKKKNK